MPHSQVPPKAPPPKRHKSGGIVTTTDTPVIRNTESSQDVDVVQPTNMTLVARIQSLAAGECCSESRYIDFNTTDRQTFDQVVKALRSTVNKAVSRAAARTGGEYSTVTGHYMTRDNNIVVVATALRTG